MDLRKEYYTRMLDTFMKSYGNIIENAPEGHCMKVTGFPSDVLPNLRAKVMETTSKADCFILSEEKTGAEFITPTKLIELRNDLSKPILVLIPVNSNTAAEDSYGNATFQDLNVKELDGRLLASLIKEAEGNHTVKTALNYADKNLNVSTSNKINYLLYVSLNGFNKSAIGNGIFHLGLIPDEKLAIRGEYAQHFLAKNDDCITVMSEFSATIADRVVELPIKNNSLQQEVAEFLKKNILINSRQKLCEAILDCSPLNFANWDKALTDVLELGKIHVTDVVVSGQAYSDADGDPTVTVDSKRGAKIKLRVYFSPKPSQYEQLKKVKIALMNGDGFYKEHDLLTKKVTENDRAYRDITLTINHGEYNNGTYFFHVYAEDENGTELNTKDEFRDEEIQRLWEKEESSDGAMTKEDFSQKNRALLTSDSLPFYLLNKDSETETEEEEIGTRKKIRNVLMAYFRYRIELNRKGKPLTIPERKDIIDKKGRPSKEDEDTGIACWQEGTHVSTFQLRYDIDNNYQIPLSKKLLMLQRALLKNGAEMCSVNAEISDNYTDLQLKSAIAKPLAVDAPGELLDQRKALFKLIMESAPEDSGVIETFDVFRHIKKIKDYIRSFRDWMGDLLSEKIDSTLAIELQSIDTATLRVNMPDGRTVRTKLLSPLHPVRLSWLVNIYEQYQKWESTTEKDEHYRNPDVWYNKLDQLFYGTLTPDIAPLVLLDKGSAGYMQYVGELCFGWGLFANPLQEKDDTFSTGFRQLKAYLSQLLNIEMQYRIDNDVNRQMVQRLIHHYITQHPYVNKLIINLFNAGDAEVFASNLVQIEKDTKGVFDIHYEIRLFCNDKRFPQGEALKDLMNPDTSVSEEAEAFSQADDNRLFPKLRFSVNSIEEFIKEPGRFPAHMSFLINPFPTQASLKRNKTPQSSFFFNGVVMSPIVSVERRDNENEIEWQRFISDTPPANEIDFLEVSLNLFRNFQFAIAAGMASDHEASVPSLLLNIKDTNSEMLSLVHDVSDWVVTFDKNMGPEFYDMPAKQGEQPYLLDYIPSAQLNGISSFLTCRPTSEIVGIMEPHFKNFGIDISDKDAFMEFLGDIRSVSSSLIMQLQSSRNKVFEVLGTTLMKRMLKGKGLLDDSFIIPIDLHQNLFSDLESNSLERADNLLVDFHPSKREIVFTVIEIKCRQTLSEFELNALQEKMQRQIDNTVLALRTNFDPEFKSPDRLDRELRNVELQNLLLFYCRRGARYGYLNEETAKEYEKFIISLLNEPFTIRFKKMGFIYEFQSNDYQRKDFYDDTVFYILGKPMIELILEKPDQLSRTVDKDRCRQDEEMRTEFETSDRLERENSFRMDTVIDTEVEEIPKQDNNHSIAPLLDEKNDKEGANNKDLTDVTPEGQPVKPEEIEIPIIPAETNQAKPSYDIFIGKNEGTEQFGILGESINGHRKIAIDLSETNTISLFGVQGAGKSYTIGTIVEMTLKPLPSLNLLPGPMASVIFHYSESMDYAPEFTSMIYPNDETSQLKKLKQVYGAEPSNIEDVVLLCPEDKIEERKEEYPSIEIHPIKFNSKELNVQDWQFLLRAIGNDSTYIAQLKQIMKSLRKNLNIADLEANVENSPILSAAQKTLASQRLSFAKEYIDDTVELGALLRPGRLIIVDLRDEWIGEEDALGLFVVMLNIFAGVKTYEGQRFNKFIVFDEAHKYMGNKELTNSIVTTIREMRHKGVSLLIASQDPMSLPNQIIELSSIVLMHKFNSPQWVKHVQKAITQLQSLSSSDMASLPTGEAYIWATKSTEKGVTLRPMKISTRPRATKHGGDTLKAF